MSQSKPLQSAPGRGKKTHEGAGGKRNQDSLCLQRIGPGNTDNWDQMPGDSLYVAAVADGVTSQAAGANASTIAIDTLVRTLQQQTVAQNQEPLRNRVDSAIHAAHDAILTAARNDSSLSGMSTTLVVAIVTGWQLRIAHVGDSRAYLIRGDAISCLTLDHTWVQEAMDAGRLDAAAAQNHPNRHTITRHLGVTQGLRVDHTMIKPGTHRGIEVRKEVDSLTLEPGDAILVCSDGITDKISEQEILSIVSKQKQKPATAALDLVSLALKRNETDNISAALLVMPGAGITALLPQTARNSKVGIALFAAAAIVALWLSLTLLGRFNTNIPAVVTSVSQSIENDSQSAQDSQTGAADQPETANQNNGSPAIAESNTVTRAVNMSVTEPLTTATIMQTSTPEEAQTASATPTSTDPSTAAISISRTVNSVSVSETVALSSTTSLTTTDTATQVTMISDTAAVSESVTTVAQFTATPTATTMETPLPTSTRLNRPTSTPTPTPTPTYTSTPSPTSQRTPTRLAAITPTVSNATVTCPGCTVTLQEPLAETLRGTLTFVWVPQFTLDPSKFNYELVFWPDGGNPITDGFSPRGAGTHTTVNVNLDETAQVLPQLQSGQMYRWGVLLVDANDTTKRIMHLGGEHRFQFELSSSGGGEGNNSCNRYQDCP